MPTRPLLGGVLVSILASHWPNTEPKMPPPPVVVHNPTWKPAQLVLPHPLSDPKPRCESLRDKTCQIYPNVISLLAARSPRAVACNKGSLFPELVVFGLQPQSLDPTSPISNPILQARNRNPPAYMEPNTKTVGPPNTTSLGVRCPQAVACSEALNVYRVALVCSGHQHGTQPI